MAIIWGLHPIGTTAVCYTIQRAVSLSALFIFLLFYFYLKIRMELKNNLEKDSPPSLFWSIKNVLILSAFLALAILSKETGALALFMLLLMEIFISGNIIAFVKNRMVMFLALVSVSLIPVAFAIYGHRHELSMIFNNYSSLSTYTNFTWYERLLTEARVVVIYFDKIFFPFYKHFYLQRDLSLSTSLFAPITTIISILFLSMLLISAYVLRKKNQIFSISIGCFFISQLVESTIIPLHIYFEHRMYFPSIFLILATYSFVDMAVSEKPNHIIKKALTPFLIAVILYLPSQTYLRSKMYADPIAFYLNDLKVSETNLAHCNLGNEYLLLNDYKNALTHFERAISLRPDHYGGYAGAGACLLYLDKPEEAIERIKYALHLGCDNLQIYFELGLAKLLAKNSDQKIHAWQDFLQYAIVIHDNKFRNYFWTMTATLHQAKKSNQIADYENAIRNLHEASKHLDTSNEDLLFLEFIIKSYTSEPSTFLARFETARNELTAINPQSQISHLISHFQINYEEQSLSCSNELLQSPIMSISKKTTQEKIKIAMSILQPIPDEDKVKFAYLVAETFILISNLGNLEQAQAECLSITASALTILHDERKNEKFTNPWYHLLTSIIPH